MTKFTNGASYTRAGIRKLLGLPVGIGGAWSTGHVRESGEHFIFCGIGAPGRTGQNYANYFDGDQLVWHPRGDTNFSAPVFSELTSGTPAVHVFYRENDRDPFTYAGLGHPASVKRGPPIEVRWSFAIDSGIVEEEKADLEVMDDEGESELDAIAEEVLNPEGVIEGAKKQLVVNAYERDPTARARCIKRWGTSCVVCGFNFGAAYGKLGEGFIHVHHLKPISSIGEEYVLDPENDLRPVCPNCHSMLHRTKVVLSVEQLKSELAER